MCANCQVRGMDLALPDICRTPPALLPIPYPNFALGPMGIPNAWNVPLMGMPAHNLLTTIPVTDGDNPGLALGLISPSVMGPSRPLTCVHRSEEHTSAIQSLMRISYAVLCSKHKTTLDEDER